MKRAKSLKPMVQSVVALACMMASAFAMPSPVRAAEVTDVLDSMEEDKPFGGSVRLRFNSESRSGAIARQSRCLSADTLGGNCKNGNTFVLARELEFQQVRNTMNIDIRLGLYKDLELYAYLPIVIGDDAKHEFAAGVSTANSTILPANAKDALFKVPFQSVSRSGFGDMQVGLKWSPFNYFRDKSEPTWVFGVTYTAPTGTVMQASNDAVGYGLHELTLYTTISRRALQMFEPFFNLHGTPVRTGSSSSLFYSHDAQTQRYVTPGLTFGTTFGLDFIPWENIKRDERFEVEAGLTMDYIARGREYSDIWQALASPSNPCKPTEGCSNVLYSKSDVDSVTGKPGRTDGITEVESYGRFHGWGAVHYQPIRNFQLTAKVGMVTETPHYITYGDFGVDLDSKNAVNQSNTNGQNEYSPVFLPAVDTPGQRLRVLDVTTLSLMFAASGKF